MKPFNKMRSRVKREEAEFPITPVTEAPKQEIRDIEEAVNRGEFFKLGEVGAFGGSCYESRIDMNVWTPRQHPAAWLFTATK